MSSINSELENMREETEDGKRKSLHNGNYDKYVHLQLLEYMIKIWRLFTKQQKQQNKEIKGTVTSKVVLLLLKHVFDLNLLDTLPNILTLMKDLIEKETVFTNTRP